MNEPLNKQQAISKLTEFQQKLSLSMKHLNSVTKPQYVIYSQRVIDSSTQTLIEKPLMVGSSVVSSNSRERQKEQQKQRMAQLKTIVEDSFLKHFRSSKEKEKMLMGSLDELRHINQQLEKLLTDKDSQISGLSEQVSELNEQLHVMEQKATEGLSQSRRLQLQKSQLESLKIQKSKYLKQHQIDQGTIKNLQLGLKEYQLQAQRMTTLIRQKDSHLITKTRQLSILQTTHKQSTSMIDALSQQSTTLSSKLHLIESQLKQKDSYIQFIENLYLDKERENNQMKQEVGYFAGEVKGLEEKVKRMEEQVEVESGMVEGFYKLGVRLLGEWKLSLLQKKEMVRFAEIMQTEMTDCLEDGFVESSLLFEMYDQHFFGEFVNNEIAFQCQTLIMEESTALEKSVLEDRLLEQVNQKNLLQHNLNLIQLLKADRIDFAQGQQEQISNEESSSDEQVSREQNNNKEPAIDQQEGQLMCIDQQLTTQFIKQPPILTPTRSQWSHKQNQSPSPPTPSPPHSPQPPILTPQPAQQDTLTESKLHRLLPHISTPYRPPSFGKDEDQAPSESDRSTPNFTVMSVSGNHTTVEEGNGNNTIDFGNLESDSNGAGTEEQSLGLRGTETAVAQESASSSINEPLRFKISKSQKVSEIISPTYNNNNEHERSKQQSPQKSQPPSSSSEEKITCDQPEIRITKQPKSHQIGRQLTIDIQSPKHDLQAKQPHWHTAKQQPHPSDHHPHDKQKQGIRFIKKHESMTSYNPLTHQQLSPTYQKEQSDCHLMVDKNNRKNNPKKKLEFKLPMVEKSTRGSALNDLEREVMGNVQARNLRRGEMEREGSNNNANNINSNVNNINSKLHRYSSCCPKLSERLLQLLNKQSTLQLQLSTCQQHHHPHPIYHSLATLTVPGCSTPTTPQPPTTHLIITQQLQLMTELQKLIQDTYQWILLIDRMNKRGDIVDKHDRIVGRIKLKKTKTGVNHHDNKLKHKKESNEDCYETDTLFECEKEKSVYSEGDSPRGVGEMDHFDISPFDHIEAQEKHEDIHSLQKLFKEGPEISEISSVKNQSQVSQFINSRSEFVKMFDPSHFIKIQDQQLHPHAASVLPSDLPDMHSPTPYYQSPLTNGPSAFHQPSHRPHQQFTPCHQTVINDPLIGSSHHHMKFEEKSIKSMRNICGKEKEKVKVLEKRIVEITAVYRRFVERLVEEDKRKTAKMQRDFNRALSMAINLKEPVFNTNNMNNHNTNVYSASLPSSGTNPKQCQASNPTTSIKLLPSTFEQKPPIPSPSPALKPLGSKLQSKSLTQITLLSQKISQKDEIMQEKMQAYQKKIEELVMKHEETKSVVHAKVEQAQELEKRLKAEKADVQRMQKKCQQLKKQVQFLKTQNKRIKNEFSQFMSKLVIKEEQPLRAIKFNKKPSYEYEDVNRLTKDIELQVPEIMNFVESLKQEANSISPPSEVNGEKGEGEGIEGVSVSEKPEDEVGLKEDRKEQGENEKKVDTEQMRENQKQGFNSVNENEQGGNAQSINKSSQERSPYQPTPNPTPNNHSHPSSQHPLLKIQHQTSLLFHQPHPSQSPQTTLLQHQLQRLTHQNHQLLEQVDMVTMQLEEKDGEIKELENSLKSIQGFEKRLKMKLQQAEEKIRRHEARGKGKEGGEGGMVTPVKSFKEIDEQRKRKNEHFSTPIIAIDSDPTNDHMEASTINPTHHYHTTPVTQQRSKPRRGSLGSVQQNFFDLQQPNEFNNIESSKSQKEKDLRIKELEKRIEEMMMGRVEGERGRQRDNGNSHSNGKGRRW